MGDNTGTKVQIFVAVIGTVGALGAPLLANWNQFFGHPTLGSPTEQIPRPQEPSLVTIVPKPEAPQRARPGLRQESGNYHVIAKSTKSLEEASSASDNLRALGYPSQVILSSTGYYAVTLGHYSEESAKLVLSRALSDGDAPRDSFVLPVERYRKTVYP